MSYNPDKIEDWVVGGSGFWRAGEVSVTEHIVPFRGTWEQVKAHHEAILALHRRHNDELRALTVRHLAEYREIMAHRAYGRAALPRPAIPEARGEDGWVLVPREPTEAMIEAAETALSTWRKTLDRDEALMRSYRTHDRKFIASATPAEKHAIRYRAMLAAAPAPPAGDHRGEEKTRRPPPDCRNRATCDYQHIQTEPPSNIWVCTNRKCRHAVVAGVAGGEHGV